MRVLVTGGAGFIGSHLCEAYLERGDEVHVLDDLSTGSIDNIRHLRPHPRFDYTIDSVHHKAVTAELVDDCDAVIHLAAAVGVKLIVESPVRTIETNVHGTEVVLAAADKKKKKVLLASTSEVYGLSNDIPFREDGHLVMGATTKGRWSYACSKAIDEFLALAYWREKRLPSVVVRLFNTVGPRQTGQYGMVIPTFVKQALAGRPITVFGDGTQSRCFTHVADVVGAHQGDGSPGRGRAGLQHRLDRGGDHRRAGRAGQDADRFPIRDRPRALRRGVRGGVRGHAPPRPRPHQDRRTDRLPTRPRPGADSPGRHRLLQGGAPRPCPFRPFPCPDQATARRGPLLMTAWQMEHDAWQTGGRSQGLCHLPFLICHAGPGPDRRRPSLVRSPDAAPDPFPTLAKGGPGGWGGWNRKSKIRTPKSLQ